MRPAIAQALTCDLLAIMKFSCGAAKLSQHKRDDSMLRASMQVPVCLPCGSRSTFGMVVISDTSLWVLQGRSGAEQSAAQRWTITASTPGHSVAKPQYTANAGNTLIVWQHNSHVERGASRHIPLYVYICINIY